MSPSDVATKDTLIVVGSPADLQKHLVEKWRAGNTHCVSEPLRVKEVITPSLGLDEALAMITLYDAIFCQFEHVLQFLTVAVSAPRVNLSFVYPYERPVGTDFVCFENLFRAGHFASPKSESHKLYYKLIGGEHVK